MSYNSYEGDPAGRDPDARYARPKDRSSTETVATIINGVTIVVVGIFLLHIVFVVAEANMANGFVSFIYDTARALVLGFGDVFTPDDATIGVVLNYGFAALIYLVVGQLIVRALRRR